MRWPVTVAEDFRTKAQNCRHLASHSTVRAAATFEILACTFDEDARLADIAAIAAIPSIVLV